MLGGARAGWSYASWPFASIQVAPGALQVHCLRTYTFTPAEVTAVEPVGWIPLLSTGIRIHHAKRDYPDYIIFYSGGQRDKLLDALRAAGFTVGEPAG